MDRSGRVRWFRALVVLLAVGLLAGACSSGDDGGASGGTATSGTKADAGTPKDGGTLTIGLDAETQGWNPTNDQWANAAYYVAQAVYDPLMSYDANRKPKPYLAESVTSNADATEWTVKLRPGITFHDGEPLNADAVVLQYTKAKASFVIGQALAPLQSVSTVDDLTALFKMKTPWAAFPYWLTTQAGFIAAPKQLNASPADASSKPIGTGAYVFQEWVRDDHFTATKNPNYWNKGLPHPDKVVFRPIPDSQTRSASLESGQLDLMYTDNEDDIVKYRDDKSVDMVEIKADESSLVLLNTAVAPLDDVRVRQALVYGTDTGQINDLISRGIREVAVGPWSKGNPWYVETDYPTKPNVTKAKSLIDTYKKDKGISGSVKFTVGCTPTPRNQQLMELVKAQWSKIGVDIALKYTEQASYVNDAVFGRYQANCWRQFGESDPDIDYIWWHSSTAGAPGAPALNFARNKDPKMDAALDQGREVADADSRKQAYAQAQERLAADLPYVWITHTIWGIVSKKSTHGVGKPKFPDGTPGRANIGSIISILPLWIDK